MPYMIKKAVFPIAGLGTRFLPATKIIAKEMLPIVDKPLIQYAVEEAYASGIRHMIFVTGRNKRSVEDYFDTAYELEKELELSGKERLLNMVRSLVPSDMLCTYVRQPRALGLGHAVLCAKELIAGEPFAVLLPDELFLADPPVLSQMIRQFNRRGGNILGVQNIELKFSNQYGIVNGCTVDEGIMEVIDIIEKPEPCLAPSTLAVAGRYILNTSIFQELENIHPGIDGEIQLTDAIKRILSYEKVFACSFEGVRYDCGSKLGFLQATIDLAVQHAEIGKDFSAWLEAR